MPYVPFGALGGLGGMTPAQANPAPADQQNQFQQFLGGPGFGNAITALGMSLMSSPSNAPLSGFAPALQQTQRQAAMEDQARIEAEERANAAAEKAKWSEYALSVVPDQLKGLAQTDPKSALALWEQQQPKEPGAPIKVGAGETLLDPTTFQPIYEGAADQKDGFGFEKDLFAQYNAAAPVKQYQDVRNGFERVRTSANADSGVGDLGVVYGFMKMLDPGSVVREGEFATAENSSGVPEQVMGLYNRIITGERLTPQQRAQFVQSAEQLYGETASNLTDLNSQFSTRADAWGVDPSRFVVAPEVYQTSAPQSGNGPRTTSTGVNWSY